MDRKQLAYRISQIFHPAVIETPAAITALYMYGLTAGEILYFAVIPIATLTAVLYALLRIPRYRGLDMDIQKDRHIMYPPAILLLSIFAALTSLLNGPEIIVSLYPGMVGVAVVNFLVNREVKISLHTTGMGVLTAIFTGIFGMLGLAFFLASVFVGWSRIMLRRHTLTEAMLGFFVSYSLVLSSLLVWMGSA
ncbi:hypothetical protein GKQ38_03715 [Candidatus Nanohaloarchaea archaeon]|nr:hypothetical protein GKQ38_03715 [Candidatus Nanohaloarchaea archaeon]